MSQPVRRTLRFGIIVAMLALALLATPSARADGVVGTGTPASCNEGAFNAALAGGGAITFNCGGAATILVTTYKQIAINTVIDGQGLITLSGNNTYLFQVYNGRSLTLQHIALSNGSSNVTGAIENFGTTTITDSTLHDNRSSGRAGAIVNYGALTLNHATFLDNKSTESGGGIYNDGGDVTVTNSVFSGNVVTGTTGAGGAIADNSGDVTVTNTTFIYNHSLDGGAIWAGSGTHVDIGSSTVVSNSAGYGGGIENAGDLSVIGSTIAHNNAENDGGGIWNLGGLADISGATISDNRAGSGGGISNYGLRIAVTASTISGNRSVGNGGGIYSSADVTLENVTLSGNSATGNGSGGGGIYQGGDGLVVLNFVTVADNTATYGAGAYRQGSSGGMFLQNTLLANNSTGNCDGTVNSLGHNLSTDTHCASFIQAGDIINTPALLGPLANNGGPTLTHMPQPGSPAIDHGTATGDPPYDQRGVAKPQGPACDIGSVEYVPLRYVYLPIIIR